MDRLSADDIRRLIDCLDEVGDNQTEQDRAITEALQSVLDACNRGPGVQNSGVA